jgi:hypothetical protein
MTGNDTGDDRVQRLRRPDGNTVAYATTSGRTPTVAFLGGFRSDMTGTKAMALEAWAQKSGHAYLTNNLSFRSKAMQRQLEGFRLSAQQRRLWISQCKGQQYFAQCAICLDGPIQPEILRQALQRVVARHEILCTAFLRPLGLQMPIQVITKQNTLFWLNTDLTELDREKQSEMIESLLAQERCHAFNVERGPRIRLQLRTWTANRLPIKRPLPNWRCIC